MRLNLYQLCDKKHNKGSIKAILNNDLKNNIKEALFKLKEQKIKFKDISNKIGIDYTTLWRYLNKNNSISLDILENLESTSKIAFKEYIRELKYGQGNFVVKIPNKINEDLVKIIGAIIADGHLRFRKSERGYHYELIVVEEFKSNFDSFSKWFDNAFNLKLIPKKKNNHYFIYISNKIIFKFFNSIIGIPSGKKAEIVSVPEVIKQSNLEIKKAFLQGIFMFDGGVDYRNGYVSLISKSKNLIKEINEILIEINLKPDYVNLNPDKFYRYKLSFRKKEKLAKCLQLFEEKSEKWCRLKEHSYGLQTRPKDLKTSISYLESRYPRKRKNSIVFSDVIEVIYKLKEADLKDVSRELKRNKTVVYEFLRKLENWTVLCSERKHLKKIWKINPQLLT